MIEYNDLKLLKKNIFLFKREKIFYFPKLKLSKTSLK